MPLGRGAFLYIILNINLDSFNAGMCYVCVVNTCTCNNGVAETGAGCSVNGAARCKSCKTGWTITTARTKCICKCDNGVVFCKSKYKQGGKTNNGFKVK